MAKRGLFRWADIRRNAPQIADKKTFLPPHP